MTDTTPADRAAGRVAAFLDVWDAAPVQRTAPRDVISSQMSGSAVLRASDLRALLAERGPTLDGTPNAAPPLAAGGPVQGGGPYIVGEGDGCILSPSVPSGPVAYMGDGPPERQEAPLERVTREAAMAPGRPVDLPTVVGRGGCVLIVPPHPDESCGMVPTRRGLDYLAARREQHPEAG